MTEPLVYWIAHEWAPGLLERPGAPAELIVRRESLSAPESKLSGARIFVLSDLNGRAVLSLAAEVKSAFEVEEGPFAGSILLELVPDRSIQTTAIARSARWEVDTSLIQYGKLSLCPDSVRQRCSDLLSSEWTTRTSVQPPVAGSRSWTGALSRVAIRSIFSDVLRGSPLDTLERYYLHKELSPIGSEAFRRIALTDESQTDALLAALASLDPLAKTATSLEQQSDPTREVDIALAVVNPDMIVARRFLQSVEAVDLRQRLERVERAEAIHQRAVRRLARGIEAAGRVPLCSTSVDLAFALADGIVLIEVKSVNADNLESQLLGAVGQLLLYESEVSQANAGKFVRGHIVLAGEVPLSLPAICDRLARRAGVGVVHVVVAPGDESALRREAESLIRASVSMS